MSGTTNLPPVQQEQEWRVLLVDDDEDDYCLTKDMISSAQGRRMELDWAPTYEQGQLLLQTNRYDAVLVDYDLGHRTGIELIRETVARRYPAPLILYTGRGSYEVDMEAMQAGAMLYLTKSEANALLLERIIRYAIENKQLKSELDKHLQERLEILESIQDGFFAIDRQWNFIYINQRAAENGEIEAEALIGLNLWEQYPKLIGTVYEQNYRFVMEQQKPVQFEGRSVYNDTWYSISVYPSKEGISIFWRDITERKRVEAALRDMTHSLELDRARLAAVLENMPVGVWIADPQGKLVSKNEQADRIWAGDAPLTESIERYPQYSAWFADSGKKLLPEEYPVAKALLTGQTVEPVELNIQRFDDTKGTVLVSAAPINNSEGLLMGVVGVNVDISELKRAEKAREMSDERFQKAFNANPNAQVISRQEDGLIQIINDSFEQLFGYRRDEVVGKTSLELNLFANPKDRDEAIRRFQRDKHLRDFELAIQTKSGEIRQASLSVENISIENKPFLLTIIQDITERKQVEEALRKSEEKYAKAFRASPSALSLTRVSDGKLIEVNESFCQIIGFSRDEVLGHTPLELALFENPEELDELIRLTFEEGPVRHREVMVHTKNREHRNVVFSTESIEIDGEPCLLSRSIDITDRKRAEDALRENEEMLRLALSAGQAGAWSWDLLTDQLQWSDDYYRIFGFAPNSIQPTIKSGFSHLHPDDLPQIEALVQEAIEHGTKIDIIHRVVWPDGSLHWVRGLSQVFYDEQGKPARMAGIAIDVTAQKQTEAEIEAARRRTVEILESISDAFYSLDQEERFTYVNQKAGSLWGKEPSELLGRTIWEVFPVGKGTDSFYKIKQALKDHQPINFETYSKFLNQWLEVYLYPTEQGISVFFQDITQRKQAESFSVLYTKELERSNRDLQEFAFVASHDLQEPLRKIEAMGDLLLRHPENLNDRQIDLLERMRKAAGRMRAMVNGLLQLSRLTTQAQPFQAVDLNQIAQEVISDLELQIQRTGGVVEFGELPVIQADAMQMRQLLQNLIGNSLKFQSPGNTPYVKVVANQIPPDSVQILIQDNGIGFDQELAGRLFQPFHRLVGKSEFEGSGIGLAISRKIVERHGGEITVRSKIGKGTTFIVTLPVEQDSPPDEM